ncbi:MAG: hypothetical protein AAGB34_02730 [Planctomycetota bacterium]
MAVSASINGGAIASDSSGVYACDRIPLGSSQQYVNCMNNACTTYQQAIADCGTNLTCKELAKAEYELDVILCALERPESELLLGVVKILPESGRGWIIDSLCQD